MCPTCNSDLLIRAFPAMLAARPKLDLESLRVEEGESSCFFHPGKRAAETCRHCGRFVCALCVVEFDGGQWCAPCLAAATAKKTNEKLENHRVLFDSVALGLAVVPAVFVWPALLTAPAALFVALRFWKRPTSILRRYKWRFVVAIVLALLEIGLFSVLVFAVVHQATRSLKP